MTWTSEPTTHAARTAHRCDWCGQRVEPGERYSRYRWACSGDAGTVKLHPECHGAMQEAAREEGGWLEWSPGDGERPVKEDAC